jgi:hypothetical protein
MIIPHRQESFNAGILSKKLLGKVSLDQYNSALYDALNTILLKHGPAVTRPGFKTVNTVKDVTKYQRLIPFSMSSTTNILLEVGVGYFRFFTFDGQSVGAIEDPSNPGHPLEVSNSLTEAQVKAIQYAQSGDVLYMAQSAIAPKKLSRTSNTSWSFSDITFLDGPYEDMNTDTAKKLTPSATTGTNKTLTATGFTPFTADWVGRHIRLQNHATETQWGWCKITGYTSSSVVTIDIVEDFASTTATSYWRVGEWSKVTGYPATLTIHQQRLCFGGWSPLATQKIVGSKLFNYTDFSPTQPNGEVTSEEAFSFDLSTEKTSNIKWLRSFGSSLIAGTDGSEFSLFPSGPTLAPTDIASKRESTYGSSSGIPEIVGSSIVFCERLNRRLRAISYDYVSDSYKGPDLTILSDDVTLAGVEEIVFQAQPHSILWARLSDGTLAAMTIDDDQKVYAWHKHTLAEGGLIKSLAVLPSAEYKQDMLFAIVERAVDGDTVRTIEMLDRFFDGGLTPEEYNFLDSSLTYSGTAVSTLTGLEHLEGKTVRVTSENAVIGDFTVVNGEVSLEVEVTKAVVGLPYTHYIEQMPFKSPNKDSIDYALARISMCDLVLITDNTTGLKVSQGGSASSEIIWARKFNDYMDQAPTPYDPTITVRVPSKWGNFSRLRIEGTSGIPFMLIATIAGVEINA